MADSTEWTRESAVAQLELVTESLQEMQALMAEDRGWSRLDPTAVTSFTRDELTKAANQCRVMAIMNPLVKRGGLIRAGYVWGQGIGINAKDETVNEVVQDFLDDDENRAILTGHQAHLNLEGRIYSDGNVLISLWTNPLTGKVRPRILEFTEIVERITDPEDAATTWLYKRVHTVGKKTVTTYYPDLRYRPRIRPLRIEGNEIRWDAPVLHVHANTLPSGWGIGDAYAAVPWAKGYSGFLNDWARLAKALSKIAWAISSPTKSKAQQARAGIAKMGDQPAGGTVNMADMKLEAVPKTGATLDSESGRPLAAMVAAAIGIPVTTLLADPGQTGARAVAETLDNPTENEMRGRRELWTEAMRAILNYVIDRAALASASPYRDLRGREVRDGDRVEVELTGEMERTLVFAWPDLTGDDPATVVEAALKALDAEQFQGAAEATLVELILRALNVRDVDELMDKLKDDEGNLIDRTATAGDAAAQAFNRGEDPAEVLR